jgi:predicted DNA-binding transcriptional regulator AlpA
VVLRRSAPTRPPRRRLADPDAATDLPAPDLAGYVRDRRGTWRYTATGQAVPGGRDLTLRSLYRFSTPRDVVQVPADLARTEPALAWTLAWKHTLTVVLREGRLTSVLRVPVGEWERRADIPIGLWAPELTATRLLDIGDVARLAGVTPATITAYLARGRMPAPVTRIGNSPVWSRPVIQQWLTSRPGQGVRRRR